MAGILVGRINKVLLVGLLSAGIFSGPAFAERDFSPVIVKDWRFMGGVLQEQRFPSANSACGDFFQFWENPGPGYTAFYWYNRSVQSASVDAAYCVGSETPESRIRGLAQLVGTAVCPDNYIRDSAEPISSDKACYQDVPVDPDQLPGDPESPDEDAPPAEPPLLPEPDALPPVPEIAPDDGGKPGGSSGQEECSGGTSVGDPVNSTNGNKYELATDYVAAGISPIRLQRYYDSRMPVAGSMGSHWRHEYDRRIETTSATTVKVRRPNGRGFKFTNTNGQWLGSGDVSLRLAQVTDSAGVLQGWRLVTSRDHVEFYDAQGRLTQVGARGGMSQSLTYNDQGRLAAVTDSHGRTLEFAYDTQGRVSQVTVPGNAQYRYGYDAAGNLGSVTAPDGRATTYLYENAAFPHAMTGKVNAKGIQIDSTRYDAQGRAIYSVFGGGTDPVSIDYDASGSSRVTDTYGTSRSYTFQLLQGVMKSTGFTRICATCTSSARSVTHDANGNVSSRTDFNGIRTTYSHDLARNLEVSRTEAVGSAVERTVSTAWHAILNVPVSITEPGRVTTMDYDDSGNMTVLSVRDVASGEVRTWRYAYGAFGALTARTSPAGETVTHDYDEQGNLIAATTSGGLVTRYQDYDEAGRVGRVIGANGLVETFTYDAVGRVLTHEHVVVANDADGLLGAWQSFVDWLLSLFGAPPVLDVNGSNGVAVTRYTYDADGLLSGISLPDGDALQYEYDDASRLIVMKDALGNTIRISRDLAGKVLATEVSDPDGVLSYVSRRSYDALGRVHQIQGNNGQALTRNFDDEGYLLSQVDALGRQTRQEKDALYRTIAQIDAANGVARYDFNALGQLTAVTDARGSTTQYQPNAFGEVTQEQSPDRGTLQRAYANGRLVRITDARGAIQQLEHDEEGRVVTRTSMGADGSNPLVTRYGYDNGAYAGGLLTSISDASGKMAYRYNSQRNVAEKRSELKNGPVLSVRYAYTLGGKLKEVATPGRHLVQYQYDAQGRPSGVTVDGRPLLSNIRLGAGGITGWTWADGSLRREQRDLDGRIVSITSGVALTRQYGFDAGNRIISLSDTQSGTSDSYGYDVQDRLLTQAGSTQSSYRYDAVGNRTYKQRTSGGTTVETTYEIAAVGNRLQGERAGSVIKAYSYLPSGQISHDGKFSYRYDNDGRLAQVVGSSVVLSNTYNALGQRVQKKGQGILYFQYDESGHLLGEYTPGGIMVREYIWLGDRLVGMLSLQKPNALLQVHSDHLGTPRAVSKGGAVLWRWEGEAFGDSLPNETVAGPLHKLVMPLRFPGQYYDAEAGLHYNYFRDYSPGAGRYVESDPIGLGGGVNTYAYVGGSPVSFVDPYGLWTAQLGITGGGAIGNAGGSVSGGVIIDSSGGVGLYGTVGAGVGVGLEGGAGVSLGVTDANTISDTSGVGTSGTVSLGAGIGGSVGYTRGSAADGSPVNGMTLTGGVGAGVSAIIERTKTWILCP